VVGSRWWTVGSAVFVVWGVGCWVVGSGDVVMVVVVVLSLVLALMPVPMPERHR